MEYSTQINIHRFKLLMLRKQQGVVRPDPQDPRYQRELEDLEGQITAILQARGKNQLKLTKSGRKETNKDKDMPKRKDVAGKRICQHAYFT
jgi:hypothetical protein